MSVLAFTVPGETVSVNRLYERHARGVHKSAEAVAFSTKVAIYGQQARRRARFQTLACEVDVLITYYFAHTRPDGDGPTKAVLDALQLTNAKLKRIGAGLVENDNQVHDHHVRKRLDPKHPRTEIIVGPVGEVFTLELLAEGAA